MKSLKLITGIAAVSLGLAGCSDSDGPAQVAAVTPPSAGSNPVSNPGNSAGNPNSFNSKIAREFARATRSCTFADSELAANFPNPLIPPSTDDNVVPAPPSIGADVPVTYFGPAPSDTNPNLIGPLQLLTAGVLDLEAEVPTVTLPLYEGSISGSGETVWYVLTDTNDEQNAAALGLNFSAKLAFAEVAGAFREGYYDLDGNLVFNKGAVDFSPERTVAAGGSPNYFPPASFTPGPVGDGDYSPLVKVSNAGGFMYNAPVIAYDVDVEALDYCDGGTIDRSILHDKVVSICPEEGTVTLELTAGFSFGRPVLYLSMEATADLPAALEAATHAPALGNVPVGRDDSVFSAVERIFLFTNGPTDAGNPQRQGLNSAIQTGRSPLNVLGGIPTIATDYSPLWDANVGEWTQQAIDLNFRSRMTEEFQILGMVERGFVTGPGGGAYGSAGFIVNCPIVHRLL